MNQWPNGQANGAMFPQGNQGHINPASMYNNLGNGNQFDINQFTNGLTNGGSGTSTPFQNQNFQPPSSIPAKRSHDGMSASPVQGQTSRSQTPNYGALQNQQGAGGIPQFSNAPTPFAHLQQQAGSNNASPSPTLQNQQFRPPQQPRMPGAFGNQMSPGPGQNQSQNQNTMQNQMSAMNQQFNMGGNATMAGMANSMQAKMNNMSGMNDAQKAYQMRLMQHQANLRANGMLQAQNAGGQQNAMFNSAGQRQMAGQMPNGQPAAQMTPAQQQQIKRATFLKTIASHASQQGKPFNPNPAIGGRPVDLFALWHLTIQYGGSQAVDRAGQWQGLANKMGFTQPQYPTAPEELKQLHAASMSQYERLWLAQRQHNKQEQARMHAHQMAGLGGASQGSPTRASMQPPNQQSQYSQMQQGQQQPQSTPVQANAQLPQNGMTTPQQMQSLQHRRSSSVRKTEQMTPQAGAQSMAVSSPHSAGKANLRSPSVKQEAPVMKSEEFQSTDYHPCAQAIESDGGYDVPALEALGSAIGRSMPIHPEVDEMGIIDTKAITLSLASGLHAEVRYALDALGTISKDSRTAFDLPKCEDLMDIIIDCAEEQVEQLSEEAAEVSDALDLAPYEDVIRASKAESETLQDVPAFGTQAWELDRAADKLIAITTILRNFSFYEHNHALLTSTPLIKWLSNTIRLLGTRNILLRTSYNTQDFYKDMIVFLSNVCQSLELPSRDDALHILHFILAFAPQPSPSVTETGGKVRFTSFAPSVHRYLPPAIDCLAKLLARQDPNRTFYRSIFTASSSSLAISESPLDLLTKAFALSISVLPDRSKGSTSNNAQLRIVEARKAYMSQGMLAADILTNLLPNSESELARAWIESEDGWAVGLLNLAALLSVDKGPQQGPNKPRDPLGFDYESFKLITQRALAMMKRLAEKAGKGSHQSHSLTNGVEVNGVGKAEDEKAPPRWEGIPHNHTILGALTLPNTDAMALGLLCGLHEMAMQQT